ncbi:amidohydrolase [Salinicoccus hispanicus]|uniref:Amidohydrolase family protein n=1 Tax=Salinicoccus hispanicus TaxID=157225 RepID=A0A6N8U209_9STAP|nr:amidohydrolase [Salinicoccus hispanicus]MXQ51367.1 amidohydrolase family protein [Salinicoccus hispanicus]
MTTLLIKNANIIDMVMDTPYFGDILVEDGRIVHIDEEIAAGEEDVLDAEGRFLIPGFIDTHSHLLLYGLYKSLVELTPQAVRNIDEIKAALKARVDATPAGEWVVGHGYSEIELEEDRHITIDELDAISTDHPIYIRHSSAHMGVANSRALEIAGINEETPDPDGGYFARTDGRLNGLLFELPAVEVLLPHLPKPSKAEMIEALKSAEADYISKGITTASEACVGLAHGKDDYDALTAYIQQDNDMKLRLMIDYQLMLQSESLKGLSFEELKQQIETLSDGQCTLDSAKFFQDGSIQINTAALTENYHNVDDKSHIIIAQEKLEALYMDFARRGYPLTTHGNGDAAIKSIIEAYSKVNADPDYNEVTRVEHIQTGKYEDIEAMKKNNIDGSFFTNHIYYYGDKHYEKFLGPDRAEKMDPARWAEDLDVLYTLHSDCPVTPISPLDTIRIACDRKTKSGRVLGEDMKLTRFEALKAMTINGAKLNRTESENGSVEIGKAADFVLLDENPLDNDIVLEDDLILYTFIDGKMVYKRD